MSKDSSRSNTN